MKMLGATYATFIILPLCLIVLGGLEIALSNWAKRG
jgi:hypothetical protein